jgi:hypothetical protein
MDTSGVHRWRKSSRTQGADNCVELAGSLDRVRDSKNPCGPVLSANLRAFLAAVKTGRLDS